MNVSACLVTRGDCDLTSILETLPTDDIVVWDNSKGRDYGIFGRYHAIRKAKHPVVITQDDDVLVGPFVWEEILAAYEPGRLVVNYPEPWDIPWVARGAIFDCELPGIAFSKYLSRFPRDEYFTHYACDGIFALLTETKVIDAGSEDLPHGFAPGRVSTSTGWYDEKRPLIQQRCEELLCSA